MSVNNPAHAARIKCTDRFGDVKYVHYRNDRWICSNEYGQNAHLTFAGISDKQAQACEFALADCHHPAQVLAAIKRYAASDVTYELEVATPEDDLPPSGACYRAVDPTGTKLVWVPLPTLHDRLTAIIAEARQAGYAVALFNPDELEGVDLNALEQRLVMEGNTFIDETTDPEEEE
jgi:hypothetical protein